jgi:HEAT repeat protein
MTTARVRAVSLISLIVAAAAASARGDDGLEAAKRLDSEETSARAAAIETLRTMPDRDLVVARVLRDDAERAQLGPRALEALADLAGEHQLRFANAGLRTIVADAAAPLPARKAAARALAKTGSLADVSSLGDAIPAIPDESVRALVAIGGPTAVNALRRGGGDDPPLEVDAGLALLGDASRLPHLVQALRGGDAARAASLLRWATGRDLPAESAAWEGFLRRRDLAARFADVDNDKAGDAVDEIAAKLRAKDAVLAEDLVGILRDRAWPAPARDKAALALGLGEVRSAQDALLWACRSGHKEDREVGSVRMYAANALARVGDLSCAPVLVAMLNNDEDEDRISARRTGEGDFHPVDPCLIRALLRLGCRGAIDRAIDLLAGEYRTRLHRDCLRALADVGGPDCGFQPDAEKAQRKVAVDRIRAWWREHREKIAIAPKADDPGRDSFRKVVDENIAQLGGFKFLYQMRAKNLLIDLAEPALPQIEAALSHESEHIRMGAADVLAAAALRDAAKPLAAQLVIEKNPAVRTRLLAALEICGRPDGVRPIAGTDVVDAVRAALADKSIDVRIAAIRALAVVGEMGADGARLVALRDDEKNADESLRFAASAALLRLSVRRELVQLAAQLRSEDLLMRSAAARELQYAGIDLQGYDPDAAAADREAAVQRILTPAPTGLATVPYRERK